jgi:hypothetical protein
MTLPLETTAVGAPHSKHCSPFTGAPGGNGGGGGTRFPCAINFRAWQAAHSFWEVFVAFFFALNSDLDESAAEVGDCAMTTVGATNARLARAKHIRASMRIGELLSILSKDPLIGTVLDNPARPRPIRPLV